ncbi:hypothetical protein MHBO_001862 [Bonamia ostreae]|uniref:Protein kinase domain-containing protein n=1 Tax=Bonamia ostreae TaxID=126728 RepID=A0ABV2ALH1_9EUKA
MPRFEKKRRNCTSNKSSANPHQFIDADLEMTSAQPALENPPSEGWDLNHITKIRPLPGRRVHLAEIKSSKEKFVLKRLDKIQTNYPPLSSYLIEKDIHLSTSHPNVIHTFGWFETTESVYLMLEYAKKGDLFSYANSGNELRLAEYIRDVARGLLYLHEEGIIHRDLKAENVVIGDNGECKIIDFNLSARLERRAEMLTDLSRAGTLDYLSPERMLGNPYNHCF